MRNLDSFVSIERTRTKEKKKVIRHLYFVAYAYRMCVRAVWQLEDSIIIIDNDDGGVVPLCEHNREMKGKRLKIVDYYT